MKIEVIIECLNKNIELRRKELNIEVKGHLVIQKKITSDSTFKAYKNYEYTVWYIRGKERFRVITVNCKERVINDSQNEIVTNRIEEELVINIFKFIQSEDYNTILYGKL